MSLSLELEIFSDAVDADWELSRNKGVTAVPIFFMEMADL